MSHPSDALKGEEPADTHGLHTASRSFPGSLTLWLELQCRRPEMYLVASNTVLGLELDTFIILTQEREEKGLNLRASLKQRAQKSLGHIYIVNHLQNSQ